MFSKTSNGTGRENGKQLLVMFGIISFTAIIFFSLAPRASASLPFVGRLDVNEYVPLAHIEGTTNAEGKTNLGYYLTGMFKVGVAGAGVLAFLMIVWGGFTYLSTDAITGKEEGKAYIERAIGGLILALTSFIILNTINPDLVELDLTFGGPARAAPALSAPSDFDYSSDYMKALSEAIAARQKITTDAGELQKEAVELKKKADATTDPAEKTRFEQAAVAKNAQADAMWAYQAGLTAMKFNELDGKNNANNLSGYNGAATDKAIADYKHLMIVARDKGIKALDEAKVKDPANATKYETQKTDLINKASEAAKAIDAQKAAAQKYNDELEDSASDYYIPMN